MTLSAVGLVYRVFFFFKQTSTTDIYTLSLHDALPISVAQPRDRFHHLAAGNFVSLLAISAALAVEPQRLAERDRHFARARDTPSPRPRATRALHVHRDHRGPAQHREHSRARLGGPDDALVPARALREDQQRAAVGERPHRRAQGT